VTVTIPKGSPVRAIADSLLKHRVITARAPLILWLRWSHIERKIQAGRYSFSPGEGVLSASDKLMHALPDDFVVTIPEGLTIEQTAARIAAVLPIDTTEFAALCRDPLFVRELGFDSLSSLEGYLFPETYRLLESTRSSAHDREVYRGILKISLAPLCWLTGRNSHARIDCRKRGGACVRTAPYRRRFL
jgi:UPF0755 protein